MPTTRFMRSTREWNYSIREILMKLVCNELMLLEYHLKKEEEILPAKRRRRYAKSVKPRLKGFACISLILTERLILPTDVR
jgi:hypothetical protein